MRSPELKAPFWSARELREFDPAGKARCRGASDRERIEPNPRADPACVRTAVADRQGDDAVRHAGENPDGNLERAARVLDADHLLVRTVRCLEGSVEVELVCEPVFDYGRTPASWTLVDGSRHLADAVGGDQAIRLQTDLQLGIEGDRVRARHVLAPGEEIYCSLSWARDLASVADVEEANRRLDATTRYWRAWLGRAARHRWSGIQSSALTQGLTTCRRRDDRPAHLDAREAGGERTGLPYT